MELEVTRSKRSAWARSSKLRLARSLMSFMALLAGGAGGAGAGGPGSCCPAPGCEHVWHWQPPGVCNTQALRTGDQLSIVNYGHYAPIIHTHTARGHTAQSECQDVTILLPTMSLCSPSASGPVSPCAPQPVCGAAVSWDRRPVRLVLAGWRLAGPLYMLKIIYGVKSW